MSTSTVYVGFISPEICDLAPTHTFVQAKHKKIPVMWISLHTPNINFYYQWYFSKINIGLTCNIALSLRKYRQRYTQLGGCYKFTIFAFFANSVMYSNLRFWCVQLNTAHGKHHLVKMFKHFMISVKIVLCLESQETIVELSVHSSTYTHYVNNIIYRVSQEECAWLREGVPYVKVYWYNPKHLCPKLNVYGDNGQRSLKLWQLLHTYWLPNTY